MGINELFKESLRQKFIHLIDSKRGLQAKLAKAINKNSSYFSEIKRGNPVNAMHLRAIGIVLGPQKVIELLDINNKMHHRGSSEAPDSTISTGYISEYAQKVIPIDPGKRMAEIFMDKSGIELDAEGEGKLATFFIKRLEKKIAELEDQIIEETEDELIDILKVTKGGPP